MFYFNNKIREARTEKKMTQVELAEKLTQLGHKTSNTAVANWESGLNKPDIDTLEAICIILNKDGNYFFNELTSIISNNSKEIRNNSKYTELLSYYDKLNDLGKNKAIENIQDLTKINEYTEKKTDIHEA